MIYTTGIGSPVFGDGSAVRAFERFIDRWTRPERPHFISDAAFGSEHLLQKVSEFGGTATFSCSVKVLSFLWEILSSNLPPDHWRAAEQAGTGYIASCHALLDPKGGKVYQQIISSAASGATLLQETATSSTSQLSSMPSFSPTALRALSVEQLREICRTYNIKQGKKKEDFVQTIFARSATVHTQRSAVEKVLEDISAATYPRSKPIS